MDTAKSKYHQEMMVSGKPNVLINQQGIEGTEYINQTFQNFTVKEIIDMAEKYSSGVQGQSAVMRKIFDEIERENN